MSGTTASMHVAVQSKGRLLNAIKQVYSSQSKLQQFLPLTLENLVPAEGEWSQNHNHLYMNYSTRKASVPMDMTQYNYNLPHLCQHLLASCNPSHGVPVEQAIRQFRELIEYKEELILARDGGLSNGFGTFGVAYSVLVQ